ncbi:MAG: rod shape-determining protein MreD [Oscillatoria sp. PMC 1051.18]|uniref:rod shape-determining protein MreD n=1 Tax=Oscillatoria salina TaxID=331517 RepID=UPI0013B650DC|nr:rod shape-determining protein MreD [Oscillatoria salina]MBZ8182135.1 rod shape-determining protein MreD [Oscillatoria salina IIICB1]MEC4894209.1 rod shape-determining protein MreD [Oscillatoria sp. PMC 1050.18]MEC5032211.1 rod shape-determining protein MreD [Oscillatoria sp. PMC 1051.18]NET87789.1 rod shape-determining protein MreD [Kamptonema sp. SIO1D9]
MIKISQLSPLGREIVNWAVTIGSVILCTMFLLTRMPGTALLGIGPHWLLIWVVAWSVKRTVFQGAIAGLALGLIQDGMTSGLIGDSISYLPSHALSLAVVGILTACIKKQKYIQEDFISIALIVFGMAILAETLTAFQHILVGLRELAEVWSFHQRIALSSAILSSLWAPVIYYPLNLWWQRMKAFEQ